MAKAASTDLMQSLIIPQTDLLSGIGHIRHDDLPAASMCIYRLKIGMSYSTEQRKNSEQKEQNKKRTKKMVDNLATEQAANIGPRGRASSGERDDRILVYTSILSPILFR